MDSRLELLEREAWARAQQNAEHRARGSRAGTATAAGHSMSGMVLAETSIVYGSTYTLDGNKVTTSMVLGTGMGMTGTTFGTGGG